MIWPCKCFNTQQVSTELPKSDNEILPHETTAKPVILQEIKEQQVMSFVTLNLKTDFEKISHLFSQFFKSEPNWAAVAETDLAFAAPVVNTLVTLLAGPQADVAVASILSSVQKDMVLATKFIQALDNSQNLTDVLNSIVTNLQGLLTLSDVKNHTSSTQITGYVNGFIAEIEAIMAAMPTTPLTK
jgi:hypothetical protein